MNEQTAGAPNNAAQSLNIFEILNIFWSRKLIIIACVAIAFIATFIKVYFFTDDVYSASGILYVSNRNEYAQMTEEDDMVYGSDINTSRMMSTTYVEILTTRSFLMDVSRAIGGKYTWNQLKSMMSISVINETELLQVNVSSFSAEDAALVANGVLSEAPKKLGTVFDGGEVKIVERAVVPEVPNSRGTARNLLLGLLMGFAVGCAIAFVLHCIDTKIHNSDSVAKRYNISILGEISQ